MLSEQVITHLKEQNLMSSDGTKPWERTDLPNCRGLKVFIVPSTKCGFSDAVSLFTECGFRRALSPETADVCVFLGGADVDPSLYKQNPLRGTHFDRDRDTLETFYFEKCLKLEVPMFGICRGAQFLHVMNGGKLWQDVNNHAGKQHKIVDIETDEAVLANSYHHQMIQWQDKMQLVALTEEQVATRFEDENNLIDLGGVGASVFNHEMEIEACAYVDTRCFVVQGHPEWDADKKYRSWCMFKLHEFLMDWLPFAADGLGDIPWKDEEERLETMEDNRIAEEVSKLIG